MTLRMKITIRIDHAIDKAKANRGEAHAKWQTSHKQGDAESVAFYNGQICALRNLQDSLWNEEKKAIDKQREKEASSL